MNFRTIVCGVLVITFTFFIVPVASAHSTQPRVEISMDRLNPGGVVDVRGVSFGLEESVTLALIESGVDISLGEMISDPEGEFKHIVVLPSDLVEGTYYFRAVTSHHWVVSARSPSRVRPCSSMKTKAATVNRRNHCWRQSPRAR